VADSLFREALLVADRVPADAQPSPEAIRERVFLVYRSSTSAASRETMLSESRSEFERTRALIDLVAGGAVSSENLDRRREAVRELEMRGEHGAAAEGLARLLFWVVLGDPGVMVQDYEFPSEADALVRETLRLAHLHGGALPDSLRFGIVRTIAPHDRERARLLADGVQDPHLRSLAMGQVVTHWARGRRSWVPAADTTDYAGIARYAAGIPDPQVRDRALEETTRASAHPNPDVALRAAREIQSSDVRALALAHVAMRLRGSDEGEARALLEELLPFLDPLDLRSSGLRSPGVVFALYQMGEVEMLERWAAAQLTPERRAEAYLQVLEAVVAMPRDTIPDGAEQGGGS